MGFADVIPKLRFFKKALKELVELAKDADKVLLMDSSSFNIPLSKAIKKRYPETKVIALTVHKTEEYLRTTLQAGADAYVLKDATHDELLMAIENVLKGKIYLSPGVSETVIEGYLEGKESRLPSSTLGMLSPREREVLKLIAEGHKNKEIAVDLCISLKTVEKHRANLMKKLDLHNAAALTAYAIEQGLVER
jgi:DNA-binding NarL/FixJ family response regulator